MIGGLGIDLFEIDRIERELGRDTPGFAAELFTPRETEDCESRRRPAAHFAVRFAAKEALFKALGGAPRASSWRDVELCVDASGRPRMSVRGTVAEAVAANEPLVTVSRTARWAAAVVVLASGEVPPEEPRVHP